MNRSFFTVVIFILGAFCLQAQDEWTIVVTGTRTAEATQAEIVESLAHLPHNRGMELERKGSTSAYRGIPLRDLVAMVDGVDKNHPYTFDVDLWAQGYDITLVSFDGYAATFSTADYPPDSMIVAVEKDGEIVLPMIVGEVPGNLWLRELVAIELSLGQAAVKPEFELKFAMGEVTDAFTIEELETSEYFIEGEGSYTTSAGTTYTHVYGGVGFAAMLSRYAKLKSDSVITVVASDGYEMSYSGEQVLSEDGEWILAFKQDGEYLPFDPGYVRTVKIGENIAGHLSARMIDTIVIEGITFTPFELIMEGLTDVILDRQTIQSGVSCHRQEVAYLDKKTGEVSIYEGIPVWRLLAYADDPDYAPHHQESKIVSYNVDAAVKGYGVRIIASDGFERTLDSRELHMNNQVILALYKDGEELPDRDHPLVLVWDKDAEVIPDGIKAIRNVTKVVLVLRDS